MSWSEAFAFVGAIFGLAAVMWGGAFMAKWLIDDGYPWSDGGCCGCCDDCEDES